MDLSDAKEQCGSVGSQEIAWGTILIGESASCYVQDGKVLQSREPAYSHTATCVFMQVSLKHVVFLDTPEFCPHNRNFLWGLRKTRTVLGDNWCTYCSL